MALYDQIAIAAKNYTVDETDILVAQAALLLSDIEKAKRLMLYSITAVNEGLVKDVTIAELFLRCVMLVLTDTIQLPEHCLVQEVIFMIEGKETTFHHNFASLAIADIQARSCEWDGLSFIATSAYK